ncbi:MAG: PqqD family peptide modification chaperone [bacterium]|nr:PqqD family peptide modification chaperone [bacterium]
MSNVYFSQIPCRNEPAWKRKPNGAIIVRTYNKQLLYLSPLGISIYKECDGKTSIQVIIENLKIKFPDIPFDNLVWEVQQFLAHMQSVGGIFICIDNF